MFLVCEGPCSPATVEYDHAVHLGDRVLSTALARRLVYTSHYEIRGREHDYTCDVCGAIRRFGGNPHLNEILRRWDEGS